jgi:hypothetical protein
MHCALLMAGLENVVAVWAERRYGDCGKGEYAEGTYPPPRFRRAVPHLVEVRIGITPWKSI